MICGTPIGGRSPVLPAATRAPLAVDSTCRSRAARLEARADSVICADRRSTSSLRGVCSFSLNVSKKEWDGGYVLISFSVSVVMLLLLYDLPHGGELGHSGCQDRVSGFVRCGSLLGFL